MRIWWDDTMGPKSKNRCNFWSLMQIKTVGGGWGEGKKKLKWE